jgi:hypothetical protein
MINARADDFDSTLSLISFSFSALRNAAADHMA